jgi:hypothetical protein
MTPGTVDRLAGLKRGRDSLTASPASAVRLARRLLALAAVFAFLLHGAVTAAPYTGGHHHAAVSDTETHSHSEFLGGSGGQSKGADYLCCGIACMVALPSRQVRVGGAACRGKMRPTPFQAKYEFDPEGIRRPPKSEA